VVTKRWLDDDGCFLFGKYRGEPAEDVCRDDRGYVHWILTMQFTGRGR
jgi:hypothetical protein